MQLTGAEIVVECLKEQGVDTVFGYPGGMVTDLFDELYKQDDIHLVLPRHEQGLIHEAEGYARATGKPGVCLAHIIVPPLAIAALSKQIFHPGHGIFRCHQATHRVIKFVIRNHE